jgi:hypothetical protein
MEQLFDIPTTAQKLGNISIHTVRAWLSKGWLARTKVGRRTMVSESAICEFLARLNKKAASITKARETK